MENDLIEPRVVDAESKQDGSAGSLLTEDSDDGSGHESVSMKDLRDPDAAYVTQDGWVVGEGGEILDRDDVYEGFRIDSRSKAEWALELLTKIEAELIAIQLREEALHANFRALRKAQERRLKWWEWRFRPDLIEWARRELASERSRTLQLDWGRIRVRAHKESHEISDPNAAVRFVEAWAPGLVKHKKTVGVTAVLAAKKAVEEASDQEEMVILPFLITRPAGDKWIIDTAVKIGRGKGVEGDDDSDD